ncbi:MAG: DsrE family protein [Candidatus Caldarchaeum sp.]
MMTKPGVLFIILSGPEEIEKARQGLRIARNMAREKIVNEIRMLFLGPGARLLDPDNIHYDLVRKYAAEMKEQGVKLLVCTGNLKAYNLYEKFDKSLFIADDSTATVVEAMTQGLAVLTF